MKGNKNVIPREQGIVQFRMKEGNKNIMNGIVSRKTPGNRRGFTLFEILVVLILMGILAAVAMARATNTAADEVAAANNLKAHLRFAQIQAINSDISWGIYASGGGYALFKDGDTNNTFLLPGENSKIVRPSKVSIPSFTVSFDEWGRPYEVADPGAAGASPANSEITISIGSQTITITPETGFIE